MIQVALYDEEIQLIDLSQRLTGGELVSGPHGYESASLPVRFGRTDTQRWISDPAAYQVIATDQWGCTKWQGRIETISAENDGIKWSAEGDWLGLNLELLTKSYSTEPIANVIDDVLAAANALNPTHIATSTALIDVGSDTVTDEFEDVAGGKLLQEVLPADYAARVWDSGVLDFRPKTTTARTWLAPIEAHSTAYKLASVNNSVYGRGEVGNLPFTTTTVTNTISVAKHKFTRRHAFYSNCTLSDTATERDAILAENSRTTPSVTLKPTGIYTKDRKRSSFDHLRAGDILLLGNLHVDWLNETHLEIVRVRMPLRGSVPSIDVALPANTLINQIIKVTMDA